MVSPCLLVAGAANAHGCFTFDILRQVQIFARGLDNIEPVIAILAADSPAFSKGLKSSAVVFVRFRAREGHGEYERTRYEEL